MAKIKLKEKSKASSTSQPEKVTRTSSNKRACLNALPGKSKLPMNVVQKLNVPSFIAKLEVRYWKNEASLIESYFEETMRTNDKPEQFFAVLMGAMKKIAVSQEIDSRWTSYCSALIQQFQTDNSKRFFLKIYRKVQSEMKIKENEEEADMEARLTSRLLTTIETVKHKDHTQKRLDALFEEGSDNDVISNNNHFYILSLTFFSF